MVTWKSAFLVLGIAMAIPSAANAAPGDEAGAPATERGKVRANERASGLARLDADGDRSVTLEEFMKRRIARFQRLDKSGDGALDAAELAAGRAGNAARRDERRMNRLDRDADGYVTRVEYDAGPSKSEDTAKDNGGLERYRFRREAGPERRAAMFQHLDRNGDGKLERVEYDAVRKEDADYQSRRAMHIFDRDRDGKVTLEEFTSDQRARFTRLDLDGDGRITAPDLPPIQRANWMQP
ncbi:MAG: EF-hand domain-containing protein [Hyphomicrobium sp.]|nr:EF-hand domain-containing protein [Hyphomicrobium sp.]